MFVCFLYEIYKSVTFPDEGVIVSKDDVTLSLLQFNNLTNISTYMTEICYLCKSMCVYYQNHTLLPFILFIVYFQMLSQYLKLSMGLH